MLDRDEIQDELLRGAFQRSAKQGGQFEGIDLSRMSCVIREHCSPGFLAKVELAAKKSAEVVATKNFQPFLRLSVDGLTIYQESAYIFYPEAPQLGVKEWVWFWVPRVTARRLTGSVGASTPDYGNREFAVERPCQCGSGQPWASCSTKSQYCG